MNKLTDIFGQEDCNALMTALENAAITNIGGLCEVVGIDGKLVRPTDDELRDLIYDYLDKAPRTSLIVELVDELDRLGYTIKRK